MQTFAELESKKVTVVDSICGSGKTEYVIQHINETDIETPIIIITPFLTEVERYISSIHNRSFVEPDTKQDGSKMSSLIELIKKQRNIVSTHALFKMAGEDVVEALEDAGYIIICDEVMSLVETVPNIKKGDVSKMLASGDIYIEGNKVIWVGDPEDESRYKDVRMLAQADNLYVHNGSMMVWTFPPQVFRAFHKVVFLTYLFDAQQTRYYFDLYGFEYQYKAVQRDGECFVLVDYDKRAERREDLYALINVYEGDDLNAIGDDQYALSSNKLRNKMTLEEKGQLRNNLRKFFETRCKVKKEAVYYSTLKEVEIQIQPRGYKEPRLKKGEKASEKKKEIVIPINARASNRYAEKSVIAYLYNRFERPEIEAFFEGNGVRVNEDLFAASELIQWIYRSRIRNGEPIELYLPSSRMRNLLKQWANYEI